MPLPITQKLNFENFPAAFFFTLGPPGGILTNPWDPILIKGGSGGVRSPPWEVLKIMLKIQLYTFTIKRSNRSEIKKRKIKSKRALNCDFKIKIKAKLIAQN